jgi:hypothetical protein
MDTDRTELDAVLHDAGAKACHMAAENLAARARPLMPVWSVTSGTWPRGNALGPPGTLAASVHVVDGDDALGPWSDTRASYVDNFLEAPASQLHHARPGIRSVLRDSGPRGLL